MYGPNPGVFEVFSQDNLLQFKKTEKKIPAPKNAESKGVPQIPTGYSGTGYALYG